MSSKRFAKRSRKKTVAPPPPLPKKSEWDFRNVQDSEVVACYHYEFAREVPALVDRAKESYKETPMFNSFESILELNRQFPSFSSYGLGNYRFFLWYPEWARTPYLDIDEKIRLARIGILTAAEPQSDEELAARLRPLPPLPATYLPGSKAELVNVDQSKIEIVIRPWFTHDELVKAFAALLRIDFREQGKGSGNRRRPQGRAGGLAPQKQALYALGIYRLLKKRKAREVLTLLASAKPPLRMSDDESGVNRLGAQARKAIAKFESDALQHLDNDSTALIARLVCEHASTRHFRQM